MPSLQDALDNVAVVSSIKQAWTNTQQNNVEWGGWILHKDDKYCAKIKTDGNHSAIFLTRAQDTAPLERQGYTILADFHCHPGNNVAAGRPSDADIQNGLGLTYGRLVFTFDTGHLYDHHLYRRADPCPTPDGFYDNAIMWQLR